jgi:peptidoglycan/LPS O-acetylase OafA/YrhL
MKQNYRALNGLRFLAASAIVSYHYAPKVNEFGTMPAFFKNLVRSGPIALGFFYTLSGFVLTHAYSGRVPQTPLPRRSFWLARVARLYPVYLLAFVLFIPMAYEKYIHHPANGVDGIRVFLLAGALNLVALQAWTPLAQAWNGPSWSLSVEAFFYLVFPFALPRILGLRWSRLLPMLVGLWMIMIGLTVAHSRSIISESLWRGWVENSPLFWAPLFLIGIATYRVSDWWSKVPSSVASLAAATSLSVVLLLCALLPSNTNELLISGGAAPLLACVVLTFSHPKGLSSRIFGFNLLFEAGAVSYITYILQAPVWHISRLALVRSGYATAGSSTAPWQLGAYLALLLAVSFLVRQTIEQPAQRLLLTRGRLPRDGRDQGRNVDHKMEAA